MTKHRAEDMTLTLTPLGRRMEELTRRSVAYNVADPRFAELRDHVTAISETVRQSVAVLSAQHLQMQARYDALLEQVERQAAGTHAIVAASHSFRAAADANAELVNDVRAMRAELRGNAGLLNGAQAVLEAGVRRMQTSSDQLEHFLDERDRAKESERDERLREVLEDFATGLRKRERSSLGRRLLAGVDRRRDARDAARWRSSQSGDAGPAERTPADGQPIPAQSASRRAGASHLRTARVTRGAPAIIDLDAADNERRSTPRR